MTSSDISHCHGVECNKRGSCWRYLAPKTGYDYYIEPQDTRDCAFYKPIELTKKQSEALVAMKKAKAAIQNMGFVRII